MLIIYKHLIRFELQIFDTSEIILTANTNAAYLHCKFKNKATFPKPQRSNGNGNDNENVIYYHGFESFRNSDLDLTHLILNY